MKKQQSKRVIPGFGLTMGVTLAMLSIVVLIPLASLAVYSARLSFREFIEVITRPRDRKSTRLNSSHASKSRMPSSA